MNVRKYELCIETRKIQETMIWRDDPAGLSGKKIQAPDSTFMEPLVLQKYSG